MPPISGNEAKSLIELNRSALRAAFTIHGPNKEGRVLFAEVLRFCKAVHVIPELQAVKDLKKLIETVTGMGFSSRSMVNFYQFEQILRDLAGLAFSATIPQKDKEKMLMLHIKGFLETVYSVTLVVSEEQKETRSTTPAHSERRLKVRKEVKSDSLKIDLDISAALNVLKSPTQRASSSGRNTPNFLTPKSFTASNRKSLTSSGGALPGRSSRRPNLTVEVNSEASSPQASLVLAKTAKAKENDKIEAGMPVALRPPERKRGSRSPASNKVNLTPSPIDSASLYTSQKIELKQPLVVNVNQPTIPSPSIRINLLKYREFLAKKSCKTFSAKFVLKAILRAWSSCTSKSHTLT